MAQADCFLNVGGSEVDLVKNGVPLCKHAMGAIDITLKVWRLKMMVGRRGSTVLYVLTKACVMVTFWPQLWWLLQES